MELENLHENLKLDDLEHQMDGIFEQATQWQLDYKVFLSQVILQAGILAPQLG